MQILTMPLGEYQTNCYLVRGEGDKCVLIDPGYWPEALLDRLHQDRLQLEAILLTHGHFDHVGAVKALAAATGCKVYLAQEDYSQPRDPMYLYYYPLANCLAPEITFCEEAEVITAAGLAFQVLHTPGHTRGSVCYLCGDALFSGDTLFAGSCGRTDLPGGAWETIKASLNRLARLEGDYRVFPGHGESTTLSQEKRTNPYMG